MVTRGNYNRRRGRPAPANVWASLLGADGPWRLKAIRVARRIEAGSSPRQAEIGGCFAILLRSRGADLPVPGSGFKAYGTVEVK
jgi:hypothetical protein